jgi:DtxR family Mn-dependent transcriptional regulator
MIHEGDLANQNVEELAEELFTLAEDGCENVGEILQRTRVEDPEATLRDMESQGLVRSEGGRVLLTDAGRALAGRQVRRHRLAEVLFLTVFQVDDDSAVNRTACVMEHVLDPVLTDSICTFVGHPRRCPHGKPIPPGKCCEALTATVEPIVRSLDRLPVGSHARIVHVVTREPGRLMRLGGLGLSPGARLQLVQIRPVPIVRVGETDLALETEIASEVYVSPLS